MVGFVTLNYSPHRFLGTAIPIDPADTANRICLCNGLLATIGLGQRHASGYQEPPIVTAGRDVETIARFCSRLRRATLVL